MNILLKTLALCFWNIYIIGSEAGKSRRTQHYQRTTACYIKCSNSNMPRKKNRIRTAGKASCARLCSMRRGSSATAEARIFAASVKSCSTPSEKRLNRERESNKIGNHLRS